MNIRPPLLSCALAFAACQPTVTSEPLPTGEGGGSVGILDILGDIWDDALDGPDNEGRPPGDPAEMTEWVSLRASLDGQVTALLRLDDGEVDLDVDTTRVTASDGVNELTMEELHELGAPDHAYYQAIFPEAPGAEIHVRIDGPDVGALDSVGVLPDPITVWTPVAWASRAEALTLRWSRPAGGFLDYRLDGGCLDAPVTGVAWDGGALVLPGGTLVGAPDLPTSCDVTVLLTRYAAGEVDPAFGGGTFLTARDTRASFHSIP